MTETRVPARPSTDLVAWFGELSKADVPRVGGKGANLGELTRAGLPVPPGFVVTAQAYLEAMDAGGVRRSLLDEVAATDPDSPETLDAAAHRIRSLVF
jgi:pyruvate,water dikinase